MSYWDTRVLVRSIQAEAIEATWLFGLWYLSVSGLLEKWFEVTGCSAPEFPRRNLGKASPKEWMGAPGGPPERTLRCSMSAEYKRLLVREWHPIWNIPLGLQELTQDLTFVSYWA
ncbi:hypothetical protein PIB30_071881 [Stylosanthes scabra]|uniref:Uncharacterized protein n=1 Tax=Stylosanthes scabra TaxID=79078 RepID=A0ABU6VNW7_9FABA|nr:hypothetical protein [Stylosanthes scabra]